jgi:hypothetical protein
MPLRVHAARDGISLAFSAALDPRTAADPANYAVELWNYRYSGNYGSPELSVKNPGKPGHDRLEVKSATLSADGKTIFLVIDGMSVADQFSVKYAVAAADGTELRSEVVGTIRRLGPEMSGGR